jgi:hypothetical protein
VRYGEIASAIITLNKDYNDDILNGSLKRLRNEVEMYLLTLAKKFGNVKLQSVFLINNYHLVSSLLTERALDGDESSYFDTQKSMSFCLAVCLSVYLLSARSA